jgi:valyl-tRNA synthetase
MEKTYTPASVEEKHYQAWEKAGVFASDVRSNKQPYTIMMPPPNVTGSLHMGHALTFTLQDVLVRYQRMRGKDVLWQPGTDHAGIATQMIVERQLAEKKQNRREMGREAFLKKVWEWKEESGGMITRQLRRLGTSPDWARERFTMDEDLNKAVNKVFVQLYKEGLIYKDNRLVNWDPKLLTAISDLEVEQKETKANLWHLKYSVDGTGDFIVVATTRPETMLGDSAVAVHPEDERYKKLVGKMVKQPLTNRLIPIIADEYADPEKGSGAVKITPAHDFNDFAVWQRHRDKDYFRKQKEGGLINIFTPEAKVIATADIPEAYRGLDRFEARKRILADLEAQELLEKIESIANVVPHGDRSGVVIEPYLMEQWYCDAATLAKPAIKAVETGKTQFVPKQWENTYFEWMRNIQPWCISRQLWWGHQIPAWYGPDGKYFVAESEQEAQAEATQHYGKATELKRDEDVLDTWFSSALWPFSTLGWPEKTPELSRYYPTDVLVTGFDIIFFWVARMMMMGIHFMDDVPFRAVYIHALVRDEKGQKMSKTKGNVIDPLQVIEKYGTDALRFTLTSLSTPGRDIRLAESRIESGRNFATKLWNATRFCQMNGCALKQGFDPSAAKQTLNRWIAAETAEAIDKATKALDVYRFDEAANGLYQFAWTIFCDWYLEFAKPMLQSEGHEGKEETQATAAWVLNVIMHLLQPIMPYLTEEIWEALSGSKMLMKEGWPDAAKIKTDKAAMDEVRWVIEAISLIRSVRSELNVPAGAKISIIANGCDKSQKDLLARYGEFISRLARLGSIAYDQPAPTGSAQAVLGKVTFVMPLADVLDLEVERARLEKESQKLAEEISRLDQKLKNPQFTDKAPAEVVEEHQQRLQAARTTLENLDAAKKRLSA